MKTFFPFLFQGLAFGSLFAVPLAPLTGWLAAALCTRFIGDNGEIVSGFWILGLGGGAFLGMVIGFWWAAPLRWRISARNLTSPSEHSHRFSIGDWALRVVFIVIWTALALASGALGAWLLGTVARAGCSGFFGLPDPPYSCQGLSLSTGVLGFLLASSMVIWGATRLSS